MYDADYYYNLLKMYTPTAEKICSIRWKFIEKCKLRTVLDFGSGVGWFKAYAPPGVEVDTYDIAPYVQTGIRRDKYDVICLWDVLEHLPNFDFVGKLFNNCRYVALTVPILPEGKKLIEWKHFKPKEHLHYFTDEDLDALFGNWHFGRKKSGYPECKPSGPREDVESILYEKHNFTDD